MGNGSKYLLVVIPLENATTTAALGLPVDNGICGISYDPNNAEHVLSLVISPDPVILTEEAFALRVKCIHSSADILLTLTAPSMDPIKLTNVESMTVFGTGAETPQLGLQLFEGHGLFGKQTNQSTIGQRLTLDAHLRDTSIYDLFVQNCVASDGSGNPDASINIIDADGCAVGLPRAVDVPVFSSAPQKNATKHIYVYIYGFQFSSSDDVQFECTVIPCVYECPKKQCQPGNSLLPVPQNFGLQRGAELPPIKIRTTLKIVNRNAK